MNNLNKKYLKILTDNNIKYDKNKLEDINNLCLELFKIKDNNTILIKFINENKKLKIDNKIIFNQILEKFSKSNNDNIIHNIDFIKNIIPNISIENINILINEINLKNNIYINNKKIYSSLKSLLISCNKYLINNDDDIKRLLSMINAIKNTNNLKRISFYLKKIIANIDIKKYENNNYLTVINTVENIIYSDNIFITNIELFLEVINKCKKNITIHDNELESILYKIDKNIYDYIYFLNNSNNLMIDNEKINIFLSKLNYIKKNFKEIDKLNLKRGFIQGLTKDNKSYLLKYQPNKSVMELVLNCYMNVIKSNNFLVPTTFFINSDNSYFYIIQKYNTDLHKYFNILEENNKILKFNDIINIILFIINSIEILHKNNIIHCDLKLENIVINIDKKLNIKEIKIIDFDVGLFNNVPKELSNVSEKYQKIFNNKKLRGTRIYMLKNEVMSNKNDIYSMGVIALILLYKNIKLLLIFKKKKLNENIQKNKKVILQYQNILKKLNILRDSIEEYDSKIKMLNLLEEYFNNYNNDVLDFMDKNKNFNYYKEFILDCLTPVLNINELKEKYINTLFNISIE